MTAAGGGGRECAFSADAPLAQAKRSGNGSASRRVPCSNPSPAELIDKKKKARPLDELFLFGKERPNGVSVGVKTTKSCVTTLFDKLGYV